MLTRRSTKGFGLGAEVLVLVTCTNRKTAEVPPTLNLRAVKGKTIAARAAAWVGRLTDPRANTRPASSLYAGDHWQVVRSLSGGVGGTRSTSVWVCSAGYGLIPLSAPVCPYGATFAAAHPDSVVRTGGATPCSQRKAWWDVLANWPGPIPGAARTVAALAGEHKNSILLVAASQNYLDAITDDLIEAASILRPGRLAIFCAGADEGSPLAPYLVGSDARLQTALGGSLTSLNARCVRHALETGGAGDLDLAGLRRRFSNLLRRQPALTVPGRKPMSDEEVNRYVRRALSRDPLIRPSPLLKRLRDSGRACEQRRFGDPLPAGQGGTKWLIDDASSASPRCC